MGGGEGGGLLYAARPDVACDLLKGARRGLIKDVLNLFK